MISLDIFFIYVLLFWIYNFYSKSKPLIKRQNDKERKKERDKEVKKETKKERDKERKKETKKQRNKERKEEISNQEG